MKCWHTLVIKRNLAADKDVKNNAETPNVHFRSRVSSRLKKLWCGKVQTATERFEVAAWCKEIAKPEVDDLDVPRLTNEDVLNLQVAVHDAIAMAVVQRTGNLSAELASLLLLELAMRDDVVQHLAAIDKFEEHIPVIIRTNHIAKAADVRMVEECDDSGLACRANLFGLVGPLLVGTALMAIVGRATGNNLTSNLICVSRSGVEG